MGSGAQGSLELTSCDPAEVLITGAGVLTGVLIGWGKRFDTPRALVLFLARVRRQRSLHIKPALITDNGVLGPLLGLRAFFFDRLLKMASNSVLGGSDHSTYSEEVRLAVFASCGLVGKPF